MKKQYSRIEKLKYYEQLIAITQAEITIKQVKLDRYKNAYKRLKSNMYQDWNSDVQEQLDEKKSGG